MLFKTHFIFSIFFILLFLNKIENPFIFIPVFLFFSIFPDIDNKFSKIGKKKISRIFNFFTKHRGIFHSFTFVFLVSIFLFFCFKEIFYPFLFGYSLHLILDCFTKQGIRIFYPMKFKIKGFVKTGGIFENLIFVLIFAICLFLVFCRILGML